MRPTEFFLLFLPCGKGVEGGSGQFFSVLFRKTALAICILLPAPLSQKISRKSLARSRPLHPFRTAYRHLYSISRMFFSAKMPCRYATVGAFFFAFLRPDMIFRMPSFAILCQTDRTKTQQKNGAELRFADVFMLYEQKTAPPCGRSRSLLFVRKLILQFDKLLYLGEKGVDVLELAVHGSITDIGDVVHVAELLHHKLADIL